MTVGSLTLDVTNEGLPTNFWTGATAVTNCTTFIRDLVDSSVSFNPFLGPVNQPSEGWQVLAGPTLCLYLYKKQLQPVRYIIYNPNHINFGGGLGSGAVLLLSP